MPTWSVCCPMVNHSHFCKTVVSFHIGKNTPNRLIIVLAKIAINEILPEIAFLPNKACVMNANKGNNITRMLAVMGDMWRKVFT